jgi:hypothetical protein
MSWVIDCANDARSDAPQKMTIAATTTGLRPNASASRP